MRPTRSAAARMALRYRRGCARYGPGLDWWSGRESNPRPLHCERSALPTELPPQARRAILASWLRTSSSLSDLHWSMPVRAATRPIPLKSPLTDTTPATRPGQKPRFLPAAQRIAVPNSAEIAFGDFSQ
jgi:hypothetical protein